MNKTIMMAVLAIGLASSASAASSRVNFDATGVSTIYVTDTKATSTLTASADEPLSSANTNGKWFDSTTTFILDMEALNNLELAEGEIITLVTLTPSAGDAKVGLGFRNDGGSMELTLMWQEARWNNNNKNPGWALNGSGIYTLVTEFNTGNAACTYLFDAGNPTGLGQSSGLGSTNGTLSLGSVTVNSDYVTAFAVSNATLNLNANGIGKAATALATKAIPEPATAMLSLLALAGLATRRRRQ